MLRPWKDSPAETAAFDRVERWTRARFALPAEATVLVTELACALPGCPPLETVVAFWTNAETRHHFKLFKTVAAVVEDDLPPAWLKNALIVDPLVGCECC